VSGFTCLAAAAARLARVEPVRDSLRSPRRKRRRVSAGASGEWPRHGAGSGSESPTSGGVFYA
jgi:hypothetical protein